MSLLLDFKVKKVGFLAKYSILSRGWSFFAMILASILIVFVNGPSIFLYVFVIFSFSSLLHGRVGVFLLAAGGNYMRELTSLIFF